MACQGKCRAHPNDSMACSEPYHGESAQGAQATLVYLRRVQLLLSLLARLTKLPSAIGHVV